MRDASSTHHKICPPRRIGQALAFLASMAFGVAVHAQQQPAAHGAVPVTDDPRRIVHLAGGQNFRDLGGYRTKDGRTVKWGMIYRSGAMNALTPADFADLGRRRIGEIFDLRSTPERRQAPVVWPVGYAPIVHATDYRLNLGGMMAGLTNPALSEAAALDLGRTFYADLPYQFAGQYRALFQALLSGKGPVAFNCSAGKDRTGVAAALVLTVLGVPRAAVTADYLLSNRYFNPDRTLATDTAADRAARAAPVRSPLAQLLLSVDARLLDAAFAGIDRRSGSLSAYLQDELGVGPVERERLRRLYLE